MRILQIEDDLQLNNTLKKFLSRKHTVTEISDGEKAVEILDSNDTFELYIIDINLPNINGLDLVSYIRSKDLSSPIIVITGSTELSNFEDAFKNGCNEFIKKPFYLKELDIRINNLFNNEFNEEITISANIKYNTKKRELLIDDESIALRKKEKRLLELFLDNINCTVLTETIQSYVWENEIKDNYPIRQLVTELRKKFNTGEIFISAEKGIGYKFEIKK